ncbi:MAG: glycosyltransferase family 2 protein [Anaerolineales bacterium]
MSSITFSIIVPVYYNEANLPDTVPELLSLQQKLPDCRLELVFVDDGSGDRSLEILREFQRQAPETISLVRLSRNFGSMAAILAGMSAARGDCVGVIAADLQDPPELFVEMLAHWRQGVKSVFAVRQAREDPPLSRFFSSLYYQLVRKFALPGYPQGGFDFFVIDRQVVQDLLKIREKNTNLMTLIFWLGYHPVLIPYLRRERKKGKSRWTLAKKTKLFVDTFVSFSFTPIRFLSALGILTAFSSFLYGLVILLFWLFGGIPVQGWTPMMLVITFAAGLQMFMLGVLGEYLWRVLDEVRRRPPYVIDEIHPSRE